MPDAPDATPPHVNGTREFQADHSRPRLAYEAFRTLAEARARTDALVVLDLDAEPFDPLATFPARRVEADEATLDRLRISLGSAYVAFEHPFVPRTAGRVRFETSGVLDQMGGKAYRGGLRLHRKLRGLGLESEVEAVFLGVRSGLGPDFLERIAMHRDWWEAVGDGDVDAVRGLLDRGFPVGALQRGYRSALGAAARAEDLAMVRLLLDRGADPNQLDGTRSTPMTSAACQAGGSGRGAGDEILALMLAAGGRLGLREAVMLGDVDLARRLLDADPTIDVSGDAGCHHAYPFLMIAAEFGHPEMVRLLLDRGADVHGTDDDIGYTALSVAATCGRTRIAAQLLDHGADIDHVDGLDFTPLAWAAERNQGELVRLLLDRGARRTLEDAILLNDADLVAKLLPTGDEAGRRLDRLFSMCRDHFARRGDVGILRMLLDARARLGNVHFVSYRDLLCDAAEAGRLEVVRTLLEYGAQPAEADHDGVTPLEHAERAGHAEVAEVLRAALLAR